MSTASVIQQPQTSAIRTSRFFRTTPWQRMLALIALVPALVGAGCWIASLLNHDSPLTRVVEFTWGLSAFGVAFSLALVWLLAGAINWQIKEATRLRG